MASVQVDDKYPPLVLSPEEIAFFVLSGTPDGAAKTGVKLPLGATIDHRQAATAVAIIMAESGGNVYAHNSKPPDDSYGLAQINMYGNLGPARRAQFKLQNNEQLYMADLNIAVMCHIASRGDNWRPWSTYTSGAYLAHMARAQTAVQTPQDPRGKLKDPQQKQAEDAANMNPLEELLAWVQKQTLRVAGFVGGGVLIILAIILYVRSKA